MPFVSIDPGLMRQEVAYSAPYRTGTVVVNIRERRLYLVQPGGRALRYAVGVGRAEALNFHGSAVIGRKETWPKLDPDREHDASYAPLSGLCWWHGRRN